MTSEHDSKGTSEGKEIEKQEVNETEVKSTVDLEPNIAGLLCYLLWFVTGVIFLLIEKENRFIRFHAMQSVVTGVVIFVASMVLSFIPIIGWLISLLVTPVTLILWVFLMYKAYSGEMYKLPYIGKFAEEQLDKATK